MSARHPKLEPGTAIGPYVVEGVLARSPSGPVYSGRDAHHVPVALKLSEEPSSSARTRLLREARALVGLQHPSLGAMLGCGEHAKWLYFASELVRGKTARALVEEEGPVLPARALRWVIEITEALGAAHEAGVVHGDLDSASVVITRTDRARLVGFGGPRRKIEVAEDPDDIGHFSPEQLEHGMADERSDVWGVGCLLFELCVGSPPFGRGGRSTAEAIQRDDPSVPTSVSGSIADLITSCVRKMAFSRVASMRELLAMAQDALENPTAPTAVTTAVERASERAARLTSRPPPAMVHSPPPPPVRSAPPPSSPRRGISHRPLPPPAALPPRASQPAPDPVHRGHVKGTAVRAGVVWFAETYGVDALRRIAEHASPELHALLRTDDAALGVIPSSWYPTTAIGELLMRCEQAADPQDPDAYWTAMAQAIAKDNVYGVYKSLYKLVTTPATLEANAQRVWRTYFDEGALTARVSNPGEVRFELKGWIYHHAHACRAVGHVLQQALRIVGYRGLVVERTQCVAEGHAMCAFEGLYLP